MFDSSFPLSFNICGELMMVGYSICTEGKRMSRRACSTQSRISSHEQIVDDDTVTFYE